MSINVGLPLQGLEMMDDGSISLIPSVALPALILNYDDPTHLPHGATSQTCLNDRMVLHSSRTPQLPSYVPRQRVTRRLGAERRLAQLLDPRPRP